MGESKSPFYPLIGLLLRVLRGLPRISPSLSTQRVGKDKLVRGAVLSLSLVAILSLMHMPAESPLPEK